MPPPLAEIEEQMMCQVLFKTVDESATVSSPRRQQRAKGQCWGRNCSLLLTPPPPPPHTHGHTRHLHPPPSSGMVFENTLHKPNQWHRRHSQALVNNYRPGATAARHAMAEPTEHSRRRVVGAEKQACVSTNAHEPCAPRLHRLGFRGFGIACHWNDAVVLLCGSCKSLITII